MKKKDTPKVQVVVSVSVSPNDVPYVRGYLRGVLENLFCSIPVEAFELKVEGEAE